MKILIMRHAEAESGDQLDPTRELTSIGQKQAKMMAKWLKRQVETPDLVLESNMKRSQQTAAYVVDKLDAPLVRTPAIDPDGTPDGALATIMKLGKKAKAKMVIAVTHGPLVEEILAAVTKGDASLFHFAHAAVAHIDDDQIFHWLVTPNVVARDQDELDKVTSDAQAAMESAARVLEAAADRQDVKRPTAHIAKATSKLAVALKKQRGLFIKALPKSYFHEASSSDSPLTNLQPLSKILGKSFQPILAKAAGDAVKTTYAQFDSPKVTIPASVEKYLSERSLEQIGADVDATTLAELRTILSDGLAAGASFSGIVSQIREAGAFSRQRAQTIATTEVGDAFSQGTLGAAKDLQYGLDMEKSWLAEDDPCEDCQANADEGWIDVDDDFPSGDDAPTAHPNCLCALLVRRVSPGDQ